jgi:hypothetical protein
MLTFGNGFEDAFEFIDVEPFTCTAAPTAAPTPAPTAAPTPPPTLDDEAFCSSIFTGFDAFCGRTAEGYCMLNVFTGTGNRRNPGMGGTCADYCFGQGGRPCVAAVDNKPWPQVSCTVDTNNAGGCFAFWLDQICTCGPTGVPVALPALQTPTSQPSPLS